MKMFDVYSLFDLEIVKAEDTTVWDSNGQPYLDLYGGHAVISIGHGHPHYVDAITRQLQKVGFYSNSVIISLQAKLAQLLGQQSGYADYQLFLCNSGAEANENACKLASFHNGRKKIIAFSGAFHGRTSLAVALTDNPAIVAPINENSEVQFLPFNDIEAFEATIDPSYCAVIVEGIQGVAGVNVPSPEFLQSLSRKCKELGVVLILDEIQSGYGRSGKFFAHQHAGIQPDIITVAKGMGNGFPIGGLLIHPDIKPRKEMLGTTFGGNHLACAAAIAVLEVLATEQLVENAQTLGNYLKAALSNIAAIKEVRGHGLMIGIELDRPCAELRKNLLNKHHIFTGSASNKNTLRILPSLTIQQSALDAFIQALIIELN
jgi:acetylornithine aminotransferase